VRCCQLKIKLASEARIDPPQKQHSKIQELELVIAVPPAVYAALAQKAAFMQKSAGELAIMLLEAIIKGDIYDAVLDDRD
jgi:hypothetical protein